MKNNNFIKVLLLLVAVFALGLILVNKNSNTAEDQLAAGGKGKGGSGTTSAAYCSDSDNGINTTIKGTTYNYNLKPNGSQSVVSTFEDTCIGYASVTEYFCGGGSVSPRPMLCGSGNKCVSGACIAETSTSDTVAPTASMFGFVGPAGVHNDIIVYSNSTYDEWAVAVQTTDNVGIAEVRFLIDGTQTLPSDIIHFPDSPTSSYYGTNLYTMRIESEIRERGDGPHVVTAVVCDSASNCTTATGSVNATVQENTTKPN